MKTCDRDCFRCGFADCVVDTEDAEEILAAETRDREIRRAATGRTQRVRDKEQRYREAHREILLDKQRQRYAEHREEINAKRREWYHRTKDVRRAVRVRYRRDNHDRLLAYERERRRKKSAAAQIENGKLKMEN